LYRKNDDNIARIAKFKLDALHKIQTDSLGTQDKFDVLASETAKFNKQFIADAPHFKNGLRYLMGAVGMLIAVELYFVIAKRRRPVD
jgi:hypothetical protein